jgi:acyl-CoA thioesterase-1
MALVVVGGCAPREAPGPDGTAVARLAANPPSGSRAPAESRPRVVVLGDSLTAGLGLSADEAYPALLQQRLDAAGLKYHVVNAGVSGDTSAGGLSRLDWALDGDVRVLIVALGGNDALRGLPVEELRHNLSAIIERARARGIAVILAGMEAPPNFGRSYIVEFHQVYPELAKQYGVAFLPFLLEGVAGVESLNQRDGIHPTADGARLVADNVWAALRPVLEEHSGRK